MTERGRSRLFSVVHRILGKLPTGGAWGGDHTAFG